MNLLYKILFIFFIVFLSNSIKAENIEIENDYTKNIMNAGFISFDSKDFKYLKPNTDYQNLDNEKSLLFIYTPGSLNDDIQDGICSTYNEYAYLAEFIFEINKKRKTYFYLNCTHLIEGDLKLPNGSNFPFPYIGKSKHNKIRENLAILLNQFNSKGFKKEQIFLIGHSCGAWHSLYVLSQNTELANSVIAFSPSCFGPRYLLWQRNGFFRLRRDDMKKMSRRKSILNSLIFSDPFDVRENYLTLKWLDKVKGVTLIKTEGRIKNDYYYLDSQVCKFHSDLGAKEQIIKDGHNLHFSKCFQHYTDYIISFLEERIN
tara:strand:+ start:542 stop:1489 length:948 start_codon:yes stop_codon:yes gene_type:complete